MLPKNVRTGRYGEVSWPRLALGLTRYENPAKQSKEDEEGVSDIYERVPGKCMNVLLSSWKSSEYA